MHLHLNAARVSLALALAALWTGCLLPPALFALGGLQEATPAWKAMHALLPYPLLALPAVLLSAMAPAAIIIVIIP